MRIYEWAPGTAQRAYVDLDHVQAVTMRGGCDAIAVTLMFNPQVLWLNIPPSDEVQRVRMLLEACENGEITHGELMSRTNEIAPMMNGTTEWQQRQAAYAEQYLQTFIDVWNNK